MKKKKLLFDGKEIKSKKCPACKGTGEFEDVYINPKGIKVKIKTMCLLCKGSGYAI
jgi:DnaJ-class molecular chaperone